MILSSPVDLGTSRYHERAGSAFDRSTTDSFCVIIQPQLQEQYATLKGQINNNKQQSNADIPRVVANSRSARQSASSWNSAKHY